MRSPIMHIEHKGGDLTGPARIGRVTFSKSMKRVYYRGRVFQRNEIPDYKSNRYDVESGDQYWISGPK